MKQSTAAKPSSVRPLSQLQPTLLCFGYGYSAAVLARRRILDGWRVYGTTRKPEKAADIEADGAIPIVLNRDAVAPALANATHVLVSAGPEVVRQDVDEARPVDPTLDYVSEALIARGRDIAWLGYLSTTGVYGDHGGAWVDELAARKPVTERGRLRMLAENEWLTLWREHGLRVHLFRLAGIYGPGRGPFEKVRTGSAQRIIKEGQVFSRIHVEDIATVLEASIATPSAGASYNVCDDEPAPPQDVIAYAAELLGLAPPPEVPFEQAKLHMTEMARSFYAESKRVSNKKIKDELKVRLAFPSYREGLAMTLAQEGAPTAVTAW
ncbi:MAG: SDR family oxidoreductase [Rhodobacteraceae bacterium]|nr:SDR family oxidoreductase [Paracoccaceae bacterium]